MEVIGEFWSYLLLAMALGLDGFSVCLTIGLHNLRMKKVFFIGLWIGIFHTLFPFIGLMLGNVFSFALSHIATVISGSVFIFLGFYMIFSIFQVKEEQLPPPHGLKLLSLTFFVSTDSFPVGFSLGLSGFHTFVFLFLFGIVATILAWAGLMIGKKAYHIVGVYSELIGGCILILFGIHYIFFQ